MQVKRIKCPSCGIELDVRNSKSEIVKHIVCPMCQKQLTVDFPKEENLSGASVFPLGSLYYGDMCITLHEEVNPIQLPGFENVKIKVVRLIGGNTKCLVSVADKGTSVYVNEQVLEMDDEIALSIGDTLKVGNNSLTFGKPGKVIDNLQEDSQNSVSTEEPKKQHQRHQWAIAGITMVAALLIVWLLWPSKGKPEVSPTEKTTIADSIKKDTTQKKAEAPKSVSQDKGKDKTEKVDTPPEPTSEFELEQQALKGNVSAQIELGSRLIRRSGSSNVIRGIKYLRLAANNGSSEAQSTLTKVINTLQRQADRGDSIAYQILMSIDQ